MDTNSIVFLLVLSISSLCSTRVVYIKPSEGEYCPGTPCYDINTFGKMAKTFFNSNGLVVRFLEGTHLLDLPNMIVFTNLTNAVFEGNGRIEQGFHETVWQSTVVIKCTERSSTGITFFNCFSTTFRYITITNCGADIDGFLHKFRKCNASLFYFNIKVGYSHKIEHVSIQNGSGSGLLIMTHGVDVIINKSSFAQNHAKGKNCLGGNIILIYQDLLSCAPQNHVYKTLITYTNSSFGGTYCETCAFQNSFGIYIQLSQKTYDVAFILDSVIAYKNTGHGNIYIAIEVHDAPNFNMTINNLCSRAAQGYGFLIGTIIGNKDCSFSQSSTMLSLNISIANSKFVFNNNDINPAVTFGFNSVKFVTRISIKSSEVSHNIASFGLEMDLFSNELQSQLHVELSNVTAYNNSQSITSFYDVRTIRSVIHGVSITRLILQNVSISNNNNLTGLCVYHSTLILNGISVFHNNTGIDGGGLAMYGDSYLEFNNNSFLNFTNNKARQRGGAIFVQSTTQLSSIPLCFFQYSIPIPKTAKVIFSGNKAEVAGNALYGGNLNDCHFFFDSTTSAIKLFSMTFNYSAQTGPSVISSEPTDVCFCDDNNAINCSRTQLILTAYPGEEIKISVVTVGQLNGVAPASVEIQQIHTAKSELFKSNAMSCTTFAFVPRQTSYKLKVFEKEAFKLLTLSFSNCPLGFEKSNKTWSCDCEKHLKAMNTITCNAKSKMITRKGSIWIGNISDCVVAQTPCPFDYCSTAQVSFSLTDPDLQCALNRTGILCGRCQVNLSLALGSNNCIYCPQFSYLALIIPFAAAGFGLVALLMVLNLTVSIGTINGLIFYASIVKISESTGIFFPNGPIPVLSQFIAWLNLDLGIETCFYHGMTAYAKVWLQFVFPLYIWFIIATIIVLCRYSTWLSRKIGGNVVQVLATLILLSFTKIFRTFAPALTWVTLSCNHETSAVWYVDGNLGYFSKEHYILMAAAVLFLLLAVPYTLALLFDAVIEKYLTKIMLFRRQWIKFKPFVDAYHGPYKDNCRFWTGLLLLVRMSFTLVSLHLDTFGTLIFITASTTVLLSLLVTFEGVYQNKYLNILECSSFLNLGLLSALAAVYQNDNNNEQVVTVISVSAALFTFSGIFLFHIFLRIRHYFSNWCDTKKESESLLDNEESAEQLIEPTSSEVYMRRESLIN